jgi:hypothetical protein
MTAPLVGGHSAPTEGKQQLRQVLPPVDARLLGKLCRVICGKDGTSAVLRVPDWRPRRPGRESLWTRWSWRHVGEVSTAATRQQVGRQGSVTQLLLLRRYEGGRVSWFALQGG